MTTKIAPRVRDVFPEFCDELQLLIQENERPELASQVPDLQIVGRCGCGQDNCAYFYTAPPPNPSYGPEHTNIILAPTKGLIILDIEKDDIVAVEILDRPDVKMKLDMILLR